LIIYGQASGHLVPGQRLKQVKEVLCSAISAERKSPKEARSVQSVERRQRCRREQLLLPRPLLPPHRRRHHLHHLPG